jgi:ABC-type transport system involved in cytochrome c biogenesis permease subunit
MEPGRPAISSFWRKTMKLSAPKMLTFLVSIIVAAVGVIGYVGKISALDNVNFWLVLIGMLILVAGNLIKGL